MGLFLGSRVSFVAARTTNQTALTTGVADVLEFATEESDIGSRYDAVTSYAWTPPAGPFGVGTSVLISGASATTLLTLAFFKAGSVWRQTQRIVPASNNVWVELNARGIATGAEAIDVRVTATENTGGSLLLSGSAINSTFFGISG